MQAVDPDAALAEHGQAAQGHLHGDEDEEKRGRTRQLAALPVVIPRAPCRRDDRQRDDGGADTMREVDRDLRIPVVGHEAAEHQRKIGNREPGARVPHGGAHEDLGVDQDCRRRCQVAQRGAGLEFRQIPRPFNPSRRGEQRNRNRETEEYFGEARVRGRNGRRQEEQHREAAEHALRDDRCERGDAEPAHPAARLPQPEPPGQDDGEKADAAGDEAMTVFVQDAADPLRGRKGKRIPAVRRRPIGNGEA